MSDKNTMVPNLRFPEFRDAGAWEEKRLGDVSIFVRGRLPLDEITIENYVSTVNLLPEYTGVTFATKLPPSGSITKFKKMIF